MRPRSRTVLIVFATIVAAALCFALRIYKQASLRTSITRNVKQHGESASLSVSAALFTSRKPGGSRTGPALPAPDLPNLNEGASVKRILAESDPGAAALFEEGMELMDRGDSDGARGRFEHLIETYPNDKAKALASWAIGLSYYLSYYWQGGTHNLHQAANQFIRFRDAYESDKNLEELVYAAMIDIPVVSIDLMYSAPSEYERTHAAALAETTLKAFLERWPDDPQASVARAALDEVQSFMANNPVVP